VAFQVLCTRFYASKAEFALAVDPLGELSDGELTELYTDVFP
jgi:hypothetical protein